MPSRRHILRGSLMVGSFTLLGSLTGILVETTIAARLGLSAHSDTFYVAFTIPNVIITLIYASGQFSLVPFFAPLDLEKSGDQLWHRFSYAVSAIFLGMAAIALVGAAFSPWIIRGLAPGLTLEQSQVAGRLARWLFIIIVPAGIAEIFRSFLLSQNRFGLASSVAFVRNATIISCIVFGFSRYGYASIVCGYIAGYLVQFLFLGAQIWIAFPVRYSATLRGSGEAFGHLRGAGASQVTTAVAWQGLVIVERMIASFLPPGTITALNYGYKILATLSELLAGSVGTAALPALSRAVAAPAREERQRTFRTTLEISLVLVSPVTVFCLLLSRNIIRLLFERGRFTPEATALMGEVLFYYSLSLVLFAGVRILTFFLFARHESGKYVRLSLLQYGLTAVFDLLYVGGLHLGAKGIPLAMLTSLLITCGLAYRRNLGELRLSLDRSLGIFAVKNLLGSALAALAMWIVRLRLPPPVTGWANFVYLCALCVTGLLIFLATLLVSRAVPMRELLALWKPRTDS
jgi:putative peptidoglycan lipid II flippase